MAKPAKRSILNDAQRRALIQAVECAPVPEIYGIVRLRLSDLVQWLNE